MQIAAGMFWHWGAGVNLRTAAVILKARRKVQKLVSRVRFLKRITNRPLSSNDPDLNHHRLGTPTNFVACRLLARSGVHDREWKRAHESRPVV
jgi:hypothetical protein